MDKRLWLVVAVLVAASVIAVVLFGLKSAATNHAVGLITNVSEETVRLKTDSGEELTFVNRAANVSVSHLEVHMANNEPVDITWHAEGDRKVATQIDDAP